MVVVPVVETIFNSAVSHLVYGVVIVTVAFAVVFIISTITHNILICAGGSSFVL